MAVVIFIIIAGLSQAEKSNFTYGGWAPFGVRGVFNGASLVFFSYIGFDAIATTAEEVCPLSGLFDNLQASYRKNGKPLSMSFGSVVCPADLGPVLWPWRCVWQ